MKETTSLLNRFVKRKSASPTEKMLLCAAISLSGTFYRYEEHFPHSGRIRNTVFLLMIMTWICCAVNSDKDRRGFFPIFICIYWLVPYIFTFCYAARDNVKHYIKAFSFINRIAKDIVFAPFTQAVRSLNIGVNIMLTGFLFLIIAFYMFGFFLSLLNEKAYVPQRFKAADEQD